MLSLHFSLLTRVINPCTKSSLIPFKILLILIPLCLPGTILLPVSASLDSISAWFCHSLCGMPIIACLCHSSSRYCKCGPNPCLLVPVSTWLCRSDANLHLSVPLGYQILLFSTSLVPLSSCSKSNFPA